MATGNHIGEPLTGHTGWDLQVVAHVPRREVMQMAMFVYLHKEQETATRVRYRFHTLDGPDRYLVLDKQAETIWPDDANVDGVFRAAAGKVARAWADGEFPDRLIHQA
jgi:hypothetical protein